MRTEAEIKEFLATIPGQDDFGSERNEVMAEILAWVLDTELAVPYVEDEEDRLPPEEDEEEEEE